MPGSAVVVTTSSVVVPGSAVVPGSTVVVTTSSVVVPGSAVVVTTSSVVVVAGVVVVVTAFAVNSLVMLLILNSPSPLYIASISMVASIFFTDEVIARVFSYSLTSSSY